MCENTFYWAIREHETLITPLEKSPHALYLWWQYYAIKVTQTKRKTIAKPFSRQIQTEFKSPTWMLLPTLQPFRFYKQHDTDMFTGVVCPHFLFSNNDTQETTSLFWSAQQLFAQHFHLRHFVHFPLFIAIASKHFFLYKKIPSSKHTINHAPSQHHATWRCPVSWTWKTSIP